MALPLLDIGGPTEGQTIWQVLADNSGSLFAFALAFVLVAQNWLVHNRVVNSMRTYDSAVFWLNIGWIAAIALMPWGATLFGTSEAFESGGEGFGGTGLFFYGLLAVISTFMFLISRYVDRHRYLLDPGAVAHWDAHRIGGQLRSIAIITSFILSGLISLFFPMLAPYAPLVLIPLSLTIARFIGAQRDDRSSSDRPSA